MADNLPREQEGILDVLLGGDWYASRDSPDQWHPGNVLMEVRARRDGLGRDGLVLAGDRLGDLRQRGLRLLFR